MYRNDINIGHVATVLHDVAVMVAVVVIFVVVVVSHVRLYIQVILSRDFLLY
mgnify:CR=1 FL=1